MEDESDFDTTDVPAELDVDPDTLITRYGEHTLDADDLYVLREEAAFIGVPDLVARIEIERMNLLQHDNYTTAFTGIDLYDIAQVLAEAKQIRGERGNVQRAQRITELSAALESNMDGVDLHE
jgi:hypothetical protein